LHFCLPFVRSLPPSFVFSSSPLHTSKHEARRNVQELNTCTSQRSGIHKLIFAARSIKHDEACFMLIEPDRSFASSSLTFRRKSEL
jgi:hypothetical protein